jgi:hypothetical protein
MVIVGTDSVVGVMQLYAMEQMFWLDLFVMNLKTAPYPIDPSQFVLMDGSRFAFRRLEPHEAANLFLSHIEGIPPYQPKYIYDVNAATNGYFSGSGYYTSQTNATVTRREDPYQALGYSIGAAITQHSNQQFAQMAGRVYAVGLVLGSSIPGTTNGAGGVYWLKPRNWTPPVILRLAATGYEVRFAPPAQ